MRIFEPIGIPLRTSDIQNASPRQYSYEDLRPYVPTPEQQIKYNRDLAGYRMFPELPLDERFADFKVRLAEAIDRRAQFRTNMASS